MAASLRRDPRLEVEMVEGHYGEFRVLADGEEIVSGGALGFVGVLPSVTKVRQLVERILPARERAGPPQGKEV